MKNNQDKSFYTDRVIRKLTSGDHFGELALINQEQRTLTVRCGSDKVKLLTLDKKTFTRILGQITRYLNRDYSNAIDFEKSEINTGWKDQRIDLTGDLSGSKVGVSHFEERKWTENSEEIKDVLEDVNLFKKEDSREVQDAKI